VKKFGENFYCRRKYSDNQVLSDLEKTYRAVGGKDKLEKTLATIPGVVMEQLFLDNLQSG